MLYKWFINSIKNINNIIIYFSSQKSSDEESLNHHADYFMGIATLSAMMGKTSSTPVGACIVNEENIIVSVGYNSMSIDDLDGNYLHNLS